MTDQIPVPPPESNQDRTSGSTTTNIPELAVEPLKPIPRQVFFFQPDSAHPIRQEPWIIPTLRPLYKIGDNEAVHERQRFAIQYAVKGLGITTIENVQHPARSQYRARVLRDYFTMLDKFLTSFKVTDIRPDEIRQFIPLARPPFKN
ncbi:hypothetical protein K435DRAFT_868587 [Dendrothele bispora CBS 962.96]|uniref:Uncharacterized protein n=1 Tax=Dendrothele bispora (strain CBS 962.96) TaxID=1314807 RepID=A0A4S8LB93_DENBC|nr:hypothetical protein K435DRAFT_868587 [Dendrothele bispora CBS 962.96]